MPLDLMQCFSRYDLRCIDIPIMGLSAVRTVPCAFYEIQFSTLSLAGDSADMARGEKRMHQDHSTVLGLFRFVRNVLRES